MSIELRSISKQFGGVAAVKDVSFSVRDGELVALLGPSGGGKTTVLRMIAGLEMPTDGDILIRGERVNDLSVQQRNIGFVFQHYALFQNMMVFKNIAFGLKIKKWKRADIEARVTELLQLLELRERVVDRHMTPELALERRHFKTLCIDKMNLLVVADVQPHGRVHHVLGDGITVIPERLFEE